MVNGIEVIERTASEVKEVVRATLFKATNFSVAPK
jgi:hypothetical protein